MRTKEALYRLGMIALITGAGSLGYVKRADASGAHPTRQDTCTPRKDGSGLVDCVGTGPSTDTNQATSQSQENDYQPPASSFGDTEPLSNPAPTKKNTSPAPAPAPATTATPDGQGGGQQIQTGAGTDVVYYDDPRTDTSIHQPYQRPVYVHQEPGVVLSSDTPGTLERTLHDVNEHEVNGFGMVQDAVGAAVNAVTDAQGVAPHMQSGHPRVESCTTNTGFTTTQTLYAGERFAPGSCQVVGGR